MMILNPLEGEPCDLNAEALFGIKKYGHYTSLEAKREDLLEKDQFIGCGIDAYFYLLRGIKLDIQWKVRRAVGDYQGDCFFVGETPEHKIYFCQTGYGSCTGCDYYLDAAENAYCDRPYEKMMELQDDLKRRLRRFDSTAEFVRWLLSSDQNGTEYWFNSRNAIPAQSWIMDDMAEAFNLTINTKILLGVPDNGELLEAMDNRVESLYECRYVLYRDKIVRYLRQRWPADKGGLHYFLNAMLEPEDWWTVVKENADSIRVETPRFPGWSMTLPKYPGHHWEYFERVTLRELELLEEIRRRKFASGPFSKYDLD